MRRKKTGKRWAALALAAVLAAGTAQPMGAKAAGGTYTGSGTFHIDQFGEYNINASVSVTDGVITGLEITGDNFGGTYAEVNKGKLASAVEGLQSRIIGLGDTDAQGLKGLDGVSGATYSSNGIKEAVASALGLSLEETAPAVLTVDESGQMTLSYTMVSGTDQEPMYILGFNGYYENNDTAAALTMEGAAYNTEQRGDYQVVTDVSFPLTGALSQYYYNNTCIYVPAMSNLNGEINGILFENGKFSVKTIVTMYWDTLTAREQTPETPDTTQESMDVTASVAQETSAPSYQVTVPSSLDMGALSRTEDNVQEYDITVSSQDKEGTVTVTAPEGGLLYAGSHSLAFSNDFGAQSFQAKETRDAGTDEAVLGGRITIAGADVAAAAPGNYTGTTTFSITYSSDGGGGTTEPEEPQPDPGEDPGDGEEGEDLAEGTYTVDVALWHATNSTPSMGDAALVSQGVIVVDENGDMSLQLTFQSLDISGIEGYLYRLRKVDMGSVEYNQNYPSSYEAADADVLSYFTGVYDAYNDPDSPSYDGNTEGKEYPKVISIPIQKDEDMNYVEIYVPVMEAIGAGQGTQLARLHIDWSTLQAGGTAVEPENPDPGGDETDIRNLPDGVYAVTGRMLKVDKETLSMSDNAIDHTIKLTVKDGKYALTMNFRGLTIGTQLGYLSQLQYFATGYTLDQYGNPQGDLRAVTVDSYQQNEDGSRVSDQYGTDYPDEVTFELIPEALEDGYVPLQVFVPIMDAIASGTGTQPVFLALDWDTLQATTDDDPAFDDEGQTDDEETDGSGEGLLTGGSGLGTSTLPGGSSLGGSSLGGSSLGGSSLGGSSLGGSSLSAARTGDETGTALAGWAALLAVAAAAVVLALRQRRGSR